MLLKRSTLEAIESGAVSLVFRRWRRPTVRSGGSLRTSIGVLAIWRITLVDVSEITERDARLAGYSSRASLLNTLAQNEGDIYRIDVRFAGPDERVSRREDNALSARQVGAEVARLNRLDERARDGSWTRAYLAAIASRPEVSARELARTLGIEAAAFKRRVRKLKDLGLTISCPIGYRLSPRGKRVYARLERSS